MTLKSKKPACAAKQEDPAPGTAVEAAGATDHPDPGTGPGPPRLVPRVI